MNCHYQILQDTTLEEFVSFWAAAYKDPNEPLYEKFICQPLTEEGVHELFFWKNGGKLSKLKKESVDVYVSSISRLETISKDTHPEQWLKDFGTGGAIWNIFFLHIWNQKYPIFDQHVFRSMRFIQTGKVSEIPSENTQKVEIYLTEYLPFYDRLKREIQITEPRDLDRALLTFGQFIKWFKSPQKDKADENTA